jgi:pimeloyl-ACP methyl ester carboxylesterase
LGALPVAAHDHGGDGPDVLLLHGGGRNSSDWETIAGLMVGDGLRVVTADLRGHGDSGTAPWSWDAVLDDVQTVIDGVGLRQPVVVGHSLGGIIASLWATRHPECPLAVSIDGHGNPVRIDRLLGLSGEQAEDAVESFRYQMELLGIGVEPWMRDVLRQIAELDLPAIYPTIQCPLLVVSGTNTWEFGLLFDSPGDTAWTAGRDWLMAALARMAGEVPFFEHVYLDGGHDLHKEDPVGVFRLVTTRLNR